MSVDLAKIYALAEKLLGYGDKDHEVAELAQDECLVLDKIVFECCTCGWWFRQCDNATPNASEWECKECHAESAPRD